MDDYLSRFPDWFLIKSILDIQDILSVTEDFLTNVDKTTEETLLKYPNHNIVNAVKLRTALAITLDILNDELIERRKRDPSVK